ncbi:MAG TPA: triple tyrosine motif-containing protein, partial [Bacteroidales bacterium]
MSYFVRLNFFFWIILFSVQSGYSASQPSYDSEITPSLKRIRINGDSVIFISDSSNSRLEQIRKDITLNYRNHNIVFELQPADSIYYQFFLEGFDKEWTSWKYISYKEYTNIPAGRYRFKIRYIISG